MITFLDKLYASIPQKGLLLRTIRYLIRVFANLYVRFVMREKNIQSVINDNTLIISLTSYPARIESLWLVIKTLASQKEVNNYVIILWLSKVQFPKEVCSLPLNLRRWIGKGLDIRFVDDDLKSHKKYYYAFKEYPDHVIVTVDDDVLYPLCLLKILLEAHKSYPQSVVCNRAVTILREKPYKKWLIVDSFMKPMKNVLPTGIGGILYPPYSYDNAVFNVEVIKATCINGDDLWLNLMCRIKGTRVVHTGANFGFITILATQKTALCVENTGNDKNDEQITAISKCLQSFYGCDFFVNSTSEI